jgi:diguanylate cyclase (GGDEF)-like protein
VVALYWNIWIYALFLFVGAAFTAILGITAIARHRNTLVTIFLFICLVSALYIFGYGMELTRTTIENVKTWSRIQYMGLPFIGSLVFIFVYYFITSSRKPGRAILLLPLLISIVLVVVRQTNHIHHLYYTKLFFNDREGFQVMTFGKGPWYWVLATYNMLCIVVPAVLMGQFLIRSPKAYRRQARYVLLGVVFPIVPYLIYISGVGPDGIDIMPAALVFSVSFFSIAILSHDLFSLAPIGRDVLVETMADAVFVLDDHHRIADANPAAREAFCTEEADPIGKSLEEAFPLINPALKSGDRVSASDKIWQLSRIPLPKSGKSSPGSLIVAHDITESDRLLSRLELLARQDSLTGLLNRHSWLEAVETELSRLSRKKREGSVIFVDLDHFKQFNDTHGHALGDIALKRAALVLKEGVRRPDLVGRQGGEEFVLFLPESDPSDAAVVAERLRADLETSLAADEEINDSMTGSFGVYGRVIDDEVDLKDMVARADEAMFASKEAGRNRVTVWNKKDRD